MSQTASMGDNRTGIKRSEKQAEDMQTGSSEFPPTSEGTVEGAGKVRILYAREGHMLGSVPPPANLKGKAKEALGAGPDSTLMDKLGERLAFERTGTRLYEALVSKHEAYGGFSGGPSRAELLEILREEHRHFSMLEEAIRELDGDPTAMTPSADLAATAAEGVQKVITDPRTTLVQSLEAILIAELTDNDGWTMLSEHARKSGYDDLTERCEQALATEERHLEQVRSWLRAAYA